jgi:hypothetical protein
MSVEVRLTEPVPELSRGDWNLAVFVDGEFEWLVSYWPFERADTWEPHITARHPGWTSFSFYEGRLDSSRTVFTGKPLCGWVRS